MIGYQIYERRSVVIDDDDPDEIRTIKEYQVSPVYLSEDKAKEEIERLKSNSPKEYSGGGPMTPCVYSEGFYIKPVTIEE